jgi:prepilin-type N-terminal cleavage/methylation domain-containing protein
MIRNLSRGFTLIELLVVIAVIAILATIAYPTYIGIQERAKVTKDLNNLRQIGIGTQLYMNDNDGALFSTATSWMSQLHPKYLPSWNVFQSPFDNPVAPRTALEDNTNSAVSYGINNGPPATLWSEHLLTKFPNHPFLYCSPRLKLQGRQLGSWAPPGSRLCRASQFSASAETRQQATLMEVLPREARIVRARRSTRSSLICI